LCIHYTAQDSKIDWQFSVMAKKYNKIKIGKLLSGNYRLLNQSGLHFNFLGRLSGIATLTKKYVDKISHTQTKILDTRKQLLGFVILKK